MNVAKTKKNSQPLSPRHNLKHTIFPKLLNSLKSSNYMCRKTKDIHYFILISCQNYEWALSKGHIFGGKKKEKRKKALDFGMKENFKNYLKLAFI